MSSRPPRKSVHFEDGSNVPDRVPGVEDDFLDSASDDTDETIRPGRPSPYTYDMTLHPPLESRGRSSSRSTLASGEELLHMTSASSSTTQPLYHRIWSSQTSSSPSDAQHKASEQPRGYGTMAAPSISQTAVQQTRYASLRHAHQESVAPRRILRLWQLLWGRLGRMNTPIQARIRSESTANEELQARVDSDDSSTPSMRDSMAKSFRIVRSQAALLGARTWQSEAGRAALAFCYMLILAAVVFCIGYGVHKLAMMGRRERYDRVIGRP